MKYRWFALSAAIVAGIAFSQLLFAQEEAAPPAGRGKGKAAPPKSNLPFDPHDISGIWRNQIGRASCRERV